MYGGFDECRHRPVLFATANIHQEIPENFLPVRGVNHFRVKLQAPELAFLVAYRCNNVPGLRQNSEASRKHFDAVAVTHPDREWVRNTGEEGSGIGQIYDGLAEFPLISGYYLPASRPCHQLQAVTDSQHGNTQIEKLGRQPGAPRPADGIGAPRKNDSDGLQAFYTVHRRSKGGDFTVNRKLADPARDQLGILRAKIQNEYRLAVNRNLLRNQFG